MIYQIGKWIRIWIYISDFYSIFVIWLALPLLTLVLDFLVHFNDKNWYTKIGCLLLFGLVVKEKNIPIYFLFDLKKSC